MRKTCKRRAGGSLNETRPSIKLGDVDIHSGSVLFSKTMNGWETVANLNKAFSETWKTMHIVCKYVDYVKHIGNINKSFGNIAKMNGDPSVNTHGNAIITITNSANLYVKIDNTKIEISCQTKCSPAVSSTIDLRKIAEIAIDDKLQLKEKLVLLKNDDLLGGKRARRQTRRRHRRSIRK